MGELQWSLNDVKKNGIGILGMGVSGEAVLQRLLTVLPEIGKTVPLHLRDKNASLTSPLKQEEYPLLECHFGESWLSRLNERVLFRSPVIRPDLPPIREATASGALLTSELAWTNRECPAKCFAVTGSDGKTSTVSMLYEVLSQTAKNEGFSAFLGGNIGKPLLCELPNMTVRDRVVLELSSFQLMDCFPFSEMATVLNVSENHLDVHTSFDEYVKAKTHIFKNAKHKVIQADCPFTLPYMEKDDTVCAHRLSLSDLTKAYGNRSFVWLEGDTVCYTEGNATERILSKADMKAMGEYQLYNAMTAVAMLFPYVPLADLRKGLSAFRGVAHRMQKVAVIDGVTCYDSTIDTTPARVNTTLSAFSGKPTVICGGSDKGLSYLSLGFTLLRYAGCAVVTGQTSDKILHAIKQASFQSGMTLPIYHAADFAEAVKIAVSVTPKGEAVVLSPGCASFDMFQNYKAKSRAFSDILQGMGAVLTETESSL